MKKKDLSIETLRGIAIILMVAGHVIGHNSESGLKVSDHSFLRYVYYTFQYLRMPLFTVISGYVYSLRPLTKDANLFKFLRGKARRLLLPMVGVGTLQYLLRCIVPGINNPVELKGIWRIYFFSFDQFWFLQAIFLVFITIALLEYFMGKPTFGKWLLVFVIASLIRIFIPTIQSGFFSVKGYFELLPFFILGCGIKRFDQLSVNKRFIHALLLFFIVGFTVQQILWFKPSIEVSELFHQILMFMVGFSGITLLFYIRRNFNILSKLGFYAYGIYLFHVFGSAGSRLLVTKLGMESLWGVFFISLFIGLTLPIIIEFFILKSKIARRIFLGLK